VSQTSPAPSDNGNGSRPTLLLAEDHPGVVGVLSELLVKDFDIVAVVPDGEGLIELAGRLRPAAIVADIGLEGLDGISATTVIRRRYPVVPIVLITASHDSELQIAALAAGASAFLRKVEAGSLVDVLNLLLHIEHESSESHA
jgi:DNA-binding NarL/FixJ family response regulator